MYFQRHAENAVQKLAGMFGAVLVTGPRQAGKTTMLQAVAKDVTYVTLDDPVQLASATEWSGTFLRDNPPPVFIDEIQYAPALFPHIKMILDRDKGKGQFFLSGSQQFAMMKNVSESLAGRIGMLTLLGLSLREKMLVPFDAPFLPTEAYFSARKAFDSNFAYADIWSFIQRGNLPELWANRNYDWQMFYAAYVRTYIERDVRALSQVGDETKFLRFMAVLAASTGQMVNLSSIARDVGISQPTADKWLSVLVSAHVVYLLQPYANNIVKRAVKTPKLYFLDTGLAAYLTRWNTPDVLKNGAMSGPFFETFVIAEIIKSYFNRGILEPPLYYYRDKEKNEIDLLIYENGVLHPLEMKKHADPQKKDIAAFRTLDKIPGVVRGSGGVICTYDRLTSLSENDYVIPVGYL